ncbi:hypothetical protein F4804DRAFT_56655 [Jackrogersella minutella]|nr:hypothetical protein F4804DRAFT_56655 [Jackrogersella minutella]
MDLSTNTSSNGPQKVSNILELPDEILKEICGHCLIQCDWICLSLVCRRFRDFAAAQLYRHFHIVFPDVDDPYFDSPIDGLAGGLSTFATSDYNYAQHLREISLDTLSTGDIAEAAYRPYLASVSCGKFMNTLLLLTLRKAKSLDVFRWNIRVELSRPVYKQLHEIKSLRHLHLRLQAGPSNYENPPALPYIPHYEFETTPGAPSGPPSDSFLESAVLSGPPIPVHKTAWKYKVMKKPSSAPEPPTMSGFRNLESLSILDIDSLDIITEIKDCVRNSSSSLRKLKLSFSFDLAMKARKPLTDTELDSEDEEYQVVPLSGTADYNNNGLAKVFRAQAERKAQEAALGRIFGLEHSQIKKSRVATEEKKEKKEKELQQQQPVSEGQRFIQDVNRVFRRMTERVNGTSISSLEQQEALNVITKAAKKYVESEELKAKSDSPTPDEPVNDELRSHSKEGEPSLTLDGSTDGPKLLDDGAKDHPPKTKGSPYDVNPDDIDIAAPEEELGVDIQQIVDAVTANVPPSKGLTGTEQINEGGNNVSSGDFQAIDTNLTEAEGRQGFDNDNVEHAEHEMESPCAESNGIGHREDLIAQEKERMFRDASKYARDTRGISLETLCIYLIPIKASVLGKAIDLHTLNRVTLLNVGEQKRFWTLMMRENRLKPLPLRKIYTDDVCLQFLQLVSELECVNEVFMLQRSPKYHPESFAPRPGTNIEQIRKLVLRKHLPSIQRLMIKNQVDTSWDVDEKTIQLICRRGKVLEELAIIMGMRAIHTFIQHIVGLVNLRALQLVSFRTEDTCLSVMRETRRFIVDAIYHHRELKLEWLALGDEEHVVRINRKPATSKKTKKDSAKGKELATDLSPPYNITGPFPAVPVEWDSASESEDDEEDSLLSRPKLQIVDGFSFYDVWGVRIFKKEILSGRL